MSEAGKGPAGALSTTCSGPEATRALAGRLASLLVAGDVLLLEGDLGAGKTTFTQGLAAALGVTQAVTSPTFVLVGVYPTDRGFDLVHADVYRLERLSEVADLGLAEMADEGAVLVVEWGDRASAALPPDRLRVVLEVAAADESRTVGLVPEGPSWEGRLAALTGVVDG
jgi:tRNA threonylcarbamoyladenosine biosynthesis protein TsaE